ncbi:MAG: aldehyde dehydrogenase family protein [Acidimicrobiales bacterium]|nr:aldehyde dehydrogenase family protein [Acidimicrobiales bacterium]
MSEHYRLLIGGEWVEGDDGTYPVVNPATEEVVGEAPEASVAQAAAATQAAAEAFPAWSRTSAEHRAELLGKAADAVRAEVPDLVDLVQAETGATLRVAKTMQLPNVAERLDRYARGAVEQLSVALPPLEMPATALAPGGLMGAVVERRPVGVVACITPYNFPAVNCAGKIGPALAMGNTVVIKPAPQDPLAVIRLVEILDEVGFPPGVVNIVTGAGPATGEAIVASDATDMVSFTGSTSVGQAIGAVAGGSMKRLLLELGGKGAAIVFDDADLKQVIPQLVSTWAFHSGQICTAPTRVIAHRDVYEPLLAGMAQAAERLEVGDPLDSGTVVGPVITEAHRDRVQAMIDQGKQSASVRVGGELPDIDTGFYLAPTLLADCKPDDPAVQQEFFGPVVVALPFDDEDEAVELANGTEFGLYDYVFTSDTGRGLRVGRQLRSGNVGLNTLQRHHEAAFGGMKQSGVGRDGGSFGLHAYSEQQSIVWPG